MASHRIATHRDRDIPAHHRSQNLFFFSFMTLKSLPSYDYYYFSFTILSPCVSAKVCVPEPEITRNLYGIVRSIVQRFPRDGITVSSFPFYSLSLFYVYKWIYIQFIYISLSFATPMSAALLRNWILSLSLSFLVSCFLYFVLPNSSDMFLCVTLQTIYTAPNHYTWNMSGFDHE